MTLLKKFFFWVCTTTVASLLSLSIIITTFFVGGLLLISFLGKLTTDISSSKINVVPNSCLVLEFPEPISESFNFSLSNIFSASKKFSFTDVLAAVNSAATDPKISSIKLNLNAWQLSNRQSSELNSLLKKFKQSGKKVVGYAVSLDNSNYLSASICDRIGMPDSKSAVVSLTSYSTTIPYYKELLDKIGVEMQVIHIGAYKSYGENFTRNDISPEFKSETKKILDSSYNARIKSIFENREIIPNSFAQNLEKGLFALITSQQALQFNLIDELSNHDNFIKNNLKSRSTIS
ncbi:MAG: S49 family peptidase, partial [Lentisphaeria bacterium]